MNARLKIIDTNSSNTRKDFVIWAILALLLTVPGMTYGQMMAPEVMAVPELSVDHPSVRQVMSIQDRYTMELMAMSGVHAVGTGFSKEGTLAILVFASPEAPLSDLPEQLEGVPVERRAMGPVTPAITNDTELPVVGGNGALFKTWGGAGESSTFTVRPAYIGQSTSNWNECSAGTIGARVRNGNNYYVISCNHVFARVNSAALGERIVQPGRGDIACAQNLIDTIGSLADYQMLTFSTTSTNTMDAALVRINPAFVHGTTPVGGYGAPSTTTSAPSLNMSVQKYGKTTGLTSGNIAAVNVTISVGYVAGTAYFSGQFIVSSSGFCNTGDSGALVVTNNSYKRPVGLLFARSGNSYTFVTPISVILQRFNVVIDNGAAEPLPVELSSFSARTREADVELQWRTETELNNVGFAVQRSNDKESWIELSFVNGAGESYTPRQYNYLDPDALRSGSGALFYRLQQLDRDGSTSFSKILEVTARPVNMALHVFPHPVRDQAHVQVDATPEQGEGRLKLYDIHGRSYDHLTSALQVRSGRQVLSLPTGELGSGQYYLELHSTIGVTRRMFIVQR